VRRDKLRNRHNENFKIDAPQKYLQLTAGKKLAVSELDGNRTVVFDPGKANPIPCGAVLKGALRVSGGAESRFGMA
jgi:hypothetical protein